MFKILKILSPLLLATFISFNAHASVIYTFSFENVVGTVSGRVEGTITFDFLSSISDSGIGAASQLQITSFPVGLPSLNEGDLVTNWQAQAVNLFTVVNGQITDYQFGASEGNPPTTNDSVFCLNNGGQFNIPGTPRAYICGNGENYLGDASSYVYNFSGIQGVTFSEGIAVSTPSATILFAIGIAGIFLRKRKI